MKILVNRKIKRLFRAVLLIIAVFSLFSVICTASEWQHAVVYVLLSSICMGMAVFAALHLYFREQSRMLENAAAQIRDYTAGNRNARIECEEEGEVYRLFHGVNSLAAVLNAHAENEGRSKRFMKDTFSDISHQLKTPLAALNIYNGIIQEDADDAQTIREFASLSEQELDRIETLVQNLLKITKLDAGTIVIEKAEHNISEMMGRIETQFAYRAAQEGKTLILSGDDAATLWCDRNWLMEAVGNLVKNALDHTGQGDEIRITWRVFASVVQIVVSDNGSGIHPEDLPHIFKRFYRSRFSGDTQGGGLGLALTKAVVEAHNGTIEADSELGAGTAFTMNFLIPTKL